MPICFGNTVYNFDGSSNEELTKSLKPEPKTIKIKIKKPVKKPEPKKIKIKIKKPQISEEDKKEVRRLENVIEENKDKLRQIYSDDGTLDMFSETFDIKTFLSVADVFIEYEEDLFNPDYPTRKPTNKDTARFIHYIKTGEVGCTTNAYKVTPKQLNWAKKNFNKVRVLYKKEQRSKNNTNIDDNIDVNVGEVYLMSCCYRMTVAQVIKVTKCYATVQFADYIEVESEPQNYSKYKVEFNKDGTIKLTDETKRVKLSKTNFYYDGKSKKMTMEEVREHKKTIWWD